MSQSDNGQGRQYSRLLLPVVEQRRWLRRVVRGYLAYHAVPTKMSP